MPVIHQPTRLSFSSGTLIDHIYTNDILSGIIITDVANHFGIFYVVSDKLVYSPLSSKLKRIISDSNTMLFKQYLNKADFSAIQYIHCPNAAYNTFVSLYKKAFNKAFPLIETKLCKRYIKAMGFNWIINIITHQI